MGLRDWLRERSMNRTMREWAAWWRLYSSRFAHPRLIDLPPGKQIVTLSPHPDDDAIGVGGTLLKHSQSGCHVTTIILTDGAAGASGRKKAEVIRMRETEARAAAKHMGINRIIFLREPDGALSSGDATASRLRDWLNEIHPDLIYFPFFLDNHPDHRATTALLARAVEGTEWHLKCCAYETWTPLLPNIMVDISDQFECKLRAINEYRSQLEGVDYVGITRGLNRYRTSQFSHRIAYAEVFYLTDVSPYLAFWRETKQSQ